MMAERPGLSSEQVAGARRTGRLVVRGPHGVRIVDLGGDSVTIGRAPGSCDIVLVDQGVSRRHVRIESTLDGHRLVDLGSMNGTLVNERRVTTAELTLFDQVRLGDHVLVYLDGQTSAHQVLDAFTPVDGERGSPLTERLVGLGLFLHEEAERGEPLATLGAVLEELVAATGHARGLVVAERAGGGPLEAIQSVNLELPLDEAGLRSLRQDVDAALSAREASPRATALDEPGEAPTLCVPLESHLDQEARRRRAWDVRGAVLLAGRTVPWSPSREEQRLLKALARQLAVLASNDRLEKHATTDPLTGLPNRGALERALSDALVRALEPGGSVGVVLIDVDDFKAVNDTHGHAVGDEVLRHLGEKLRGVLRATDVAGRWGGEEFLVVLPGEDLVGAASAAEKLVKLVAASPAPGSGARLTISAGVAVGPLHAGDAVGLVGCADAALYAAKRAGKDCVRIHAPSLGGVPAAWLGETVELMVDLEQPTDPARSDVKGWLSCQLIAPVPLRTGALVIGREPGCEVVLHHPSVSRRHARVTVLADGRVLFEDCSRNGSRVNGVIVTGAVELCVGDHLTIGVYELTLQSGGRPDARVIDTWRVPP